MPELAPLVTGLAHLAQAIVERRARAEILEVVVDPIDRLRADADVREGESGHGACLSRRERDQGAVRKRIASSSSVKTDKGCLCSRMFRIACNRPVADFTRTAMRRYLSARGRICESSFT